MESFVEYIVKNLVDHKEDVQVTSQPDGKVTVINVTVNPEDMGKVIGKNGKIVQSIRNIVRSVSAKNNTRYVVKVN